MSDSVGGIVAECRGLLQEALPGKVFSPEDDVSAYTGKNVLRWSKTSVLSPKCIVVPETTEDVATVVKILLRGKDDNLPACPFAIKSGGHTPFAGANNINEGISIDLSHMKEVKLSSDRKVASLGPGGTWHSVAVALNGTGVAVGGGRCATTGVGGVALGGGISFFAPKVGFLADSIVNYEIVLADGTVVNANAESHPNLWKALKGGGSNFGIATRFDVTTVALPHFWTGGIPMPMNDQTSQLALAQLHSITANHAAFPDSAFGTIFAFEPTSPFGPELIWSSLVHFGDDVSSLAPSNSETKPDLLMPFMDVMRELDLPTVLANGDPMWPWGRRNLIAAIAFVNDPAAIAGVQRISAGLYEAVKDVPEIGWLYAYEPLPYLYTEKTLARGGNMLGLERRKEDLILVQLVPRWTRPEDDEIVQNAAKAWVSQISEYTQSVRKSSDFIYYNYADSFQDPIASYGEDNIRFMQKVAATYDPTRVFQTALEGGFKLPKATS